MRKLLMTAVCTLMMFYVNAQTKPVKIVFDVTSPDHDTQQSAVRHVKSMASSYPDSKFELVVYSGSVEMVLKDKSVVADEIVDLAANKNVAFKVCEQTLKHHGIDKSELLPNVETVPDGILEIVTRQSEGWGYIKESSH